jgi:Holliday junction resolvase RusA-like endonuclease
MTRRDKWAKRPGVVAYYAYTEDLRTIALSEDWVCGNALRLMFVIPMPVSWSTKKKREHAGNPHQQRPDIDNLEKGFLDAFGEDKTVWKIHCEKRWAGIGDEVGYVAAVNLAGGEYGRAGA